jgi:hypothetical protein
MAARETQVLHIALIIFVGLTVVLFVVSFFVFRNYQESQEKWKGAVTKANAAEKDLRESIKDVDALKAKIGAANTDSITAIGEAFTKDMQKYAPAFPPEKQTYRNVIEYVNSQFLVADQGRVEVADQVKTLKAQLEQAAVDRAAAEKVLKDGKDQSDAALAEERSKFNKDRATLETEKAALAGQITKKDQQVAAAKDERTKDVAKLNAVNKRLTVINEGLTSKEKEDTLSSELPDGEVRWVDQRLRTVWINRGSDDKLPRQESFSVVDKDETNMSTAKKKAKLEVTRILDRHLAEARIVEDKYENPIMPGDLIFTPLWQPGEGTHFALAGFMDIDDDGVSDRQKIKDLILANGGIIDAEATDDGEVIGAVNGGTRYVITGDRPNDKAMEKALKAYGVIETQRKEYGIRTMSIRDLLDQMGYKVDAQAVLLGREGDELKQKKEMKKEAIAKEETRNASTDKKTKKSEFTPRLPLVKRGLTF